MRRTSIAGVALGLAAVCSLYFPARADAQTCNGRSLVNRGTIQPSNAATATVSGSVTSSQGDYYTVAVYESGSYTFTFCSPGTSSYDSYLCLLDSSFVALQSSDDWCGLQAQVVRTLSPGTFYIAVSGFSSSSGTYTLAYTSTVPNSGATPGVFNPLPANGGAVGTTTPTLSANVLPSSGAATVHAEFAIDGGPYVDGTVVTGGGISTFVTGTLAEGPHTYTARAHDSAGLFSAPTATRTFTVDTSPPLAGTVNDGTGADVDWQSSATTLSANWSGFSDPQTSITYAWAIGSAPLGTNIQAYVNVGSATSATSSSLALTGNGPFFVTVRATNAAGLQTFVSSDGITLLTSAHAGALGNATVGQAYTEALAASFGTGPYTWSLDAGSLPPGLGLDGAGTVSGTPTEAGSFVFGAAVQDSLGQVRRFSFKVLVQSASGGLVVTTGNPSTPTPVAAGRVGFSYTLTLAATGGQAPYLWRFVSGTLPPGLTLDCLTGVLTGFPSRPGTYTFTMAAADVNDPTQESTAILSLTVTGTPAALIILSPAVWPAARTNGPYAALASATGGTAPYAWSISAGALPAGLTLDPAGIVSGTPTATGNASFTLTVTDGASATSNLASSLNVTDGAGPLTIGPSTMALAAQGVVYPTTFVAEGGSPGYAWTITSGALPPGLTLDLATGTLTGSPTASGLFRFVVTAVDSGGTVSTASALREINVLRTGSAGYVIVTPSPLPLAAVGTAYALPLVVVGGTAPHAWSIFSGSLPTGLALNANTGELSGTPTSAGAYAFAIEAGSSGGILSSVRLYTLSVSGPGPSGGSGGGCGFLGLEPAVLLLAVAGLRRRRRRACSG